MNQNDIVQMARKAGLPVQIFQLERFAALVAAAEREACAELRELWNTTPGGKLATAIRARSNA